MRHIVFVGLVGAIATLACSEREEQRTSALPAAEARQAPPAETTEVESKTTELARAVSVAGFHGEQLSVCVTAEALFRGPAASSVPADKMDALALMMVEEAFILTKGGKVTLTEDNADVAHLLMAACVADDREAAKRAAATLGVGSNSGDKPAKETAQVEKKSLTQWCSETFFSQVSWPLDSFKKSIAAGLMTRVESCAFPNKPVLASCTVTRENALTHATMSGWTRWHYYSASSLERDERALRRCIQSGGKWQAIDYDDPTFRNARLRELSGEARKRYDELR
jgi:hypothetical protein